MNFKEYLCSIFKTCVCTIMLAISFNSHQNNLKSPPSPLYVLINVTKDTQTILDSQPMSLKGKPPSSLVDLLSFKQHKLFQK